MHLTHQTCSSLYAIYTSNLCSKIETEEELPLPTLESWEILYLGQINEIRPKKTYTHKLFKTR